ncbi:MAG: hypothetical protein AVO33_07400 [delta proteobacterium ML8_F1]|nr:MAG: hypothetical protein AVO33_07400 [delta proteobacterium ML8_F1]
MIEKKILAVKGIQGNALHSGIKFKNKDLAVIYSETPMIVAGAFTKNLTVAAPVIVTKEKIHQPVKALVVNSGNANAATGPQGLKDAMDTCQAAATALGILPEEVLVSSTGVIGVPLPMAKLITGIENLVPGLSEENLALVPEGIITTDTFTKFGSVTLLIDGTRVTLTGMAKGSGMIHPNMATMLSFIMTDANIDHTLMQRALSEVVEDTFNMISVDGDTSTNDMVLVMSNTRAGHDKITQEDSNYHLFKAALYELLEYLSMSIAKDGEGASKLLKVQVRGAQSKADARLLAKGVITSSLVKSAFFGADANWGRIISALGASGGYLDPQKVDLTLKSRGGSIDLMRDGSPLGFDEDKAKTILIEDEIDILITLGDGEAEAKAYGCDLTYDYVKINADYRS